MCSFPVAIGIVLCLPACQRTSGVCLLSSSLFLRLPHLLVFKSTDIVAKKARPGTFRMVDTRTFLWFFGMATPHPAGNEPIFFPEAASDCRSDGRTIRRKPCRL